MAILDELLEYYIKQKVREKVIDTLNEFADVLEERIKRLCLAKTDEIDLLELVQQLRSYRK